MSCLVGTTFFLQPCVPDRWLEHYNYHRYFAKLYVGSALVSPMYGRSSELGLYIKLTPPHICLIL